MVENLHALPEENIVRVTARLETAMSPYLTPNATFHLVRPSISWDGVQGLEAVVTGPYIAFQPGLSGEDADHFVAMTHTDKDHVNLARENGALQVRLLGDGSTRLAIGTPVYHRGLQAGAVLEVQPSAEGGVEFVVGLREGFQQWVRSSTRFWALPAFSAAAGPGVLEVEVPGLLGLVRGGIAFDHFEEEDIAGEAEPPLDAYRLFADEAWARAISPPARISFTKAQGVVAGRTQLRFRGRPAWTNVPDRFGLEPCGHNSLRAVHPRHWVERCLRCPATAQWSVVGNSWRQHPQVAMVSPMRARNAVLSWLCQAVSAAPAAPLLSLDDLIRRNREALSQSATLSLQPRILARLQEEIGNGGKIQPLSYISPGPRQCLT